MLSLAFLFLLRAITVLGFDIDSKSNVAVYWGQASAGSQESLATYCASDNVDIILLSFLYNFPDPMSLDFSSACSETFSDGLLHCTQIGEDIETCQSLGKKVLLSLGGASGSYGFTNDTEAETFAGTLWNTFGGGSADERPFDDAIVDGFDFDIEDNVSTGYAALATKLREYFETGSKDYYLSAAPQCYYPDASVGDMLDNADIDFAFIQFYNNYCDVDKQFNWDTWLQFAENTSPNSDIKLYLGLPGSSTAASYGYISNLTLIESTVEDISGSSNFGGIMLWDASQGFTNEIDGETYVAQMKNILEDYASSSSSTSSSTASSSTSAISSSTTSKSTSVSSTVSSTTVSSSASSTESSTSVSSTTSSSASSSEIPTSAASTTSSTASTTSSTASTTSSTASTTSSTKSTTSAASAYSSQASTSISSIASSTSSSTSETSEPTATTTPLTSTSSSIISASTSISGSTTSSNAIGPIQATTSAILPITSAISNGAPTTTLSTQFLSSYTPSVPSSSLYATVSTPPVQTATSYPDGRSTTTLAPTTAPSSSSSSDAASPTSSSWAHERAIALNEQFAAGDLNGKSTCFDGEISCSADGQIAICNYGAWVYSNCAAGTTCFAYDTVDVVTITCNFSYLKSEFE